MGALIADLSTADVANKRYALALGVFFFDAEDAVAAADAAKAFREAMLVHMRQMATSAAVPSSRYVVKPIGGHVQHVAPAVHTISIAATPSPATASDVASDGSAAPAASASASATAASEPDAPPSYEASAASAAAAARPCAAPPLLRPVYATRAIAATPPPPQPQPQPQAAIVLAPAPSLLPPLPPTLLPPPPSAPVYEDLPPLLPVTPLRTAAAISCQACGRGALRDAVVSTTCGAVICGACASAIRRGDARSQTSTFCGACLLPWTNHASTVVCQMLRRLIERETAGNATALVA